jgi:hypothetical protein
VIGPAPRREYEVHIYFRREELLTRELEAAHATRLRFYQEQELNVIAALDQAAEYNDHQLYVMSRILSARYNGHGIFHELVAAWRW